MADPDDPDIDDAIWIDEHDVIDQCEADGCSQSPSVIFVAVTRDCATLLRFTCAEHADEAVPADAVEVRRIGADPERPRKFVLDSDDVARRLD